MERVLQAEPFRWGAMGSLGNAAYMLLRQYRFPDTYDSKKGDWFASADSDRLREWDWDHAAAVSKKYVEGRQMNLESWFQQTRPGRVLSFLVEIMKANETGWQPEGRTAKWTGFRVLGTVNRSNGYPVYSYQLFSRGPQSRTRVYTGPAAPNVKGWMSPQDRRMADLSWLGFR